MTLIFCSKISLDCFYGSEALNMRPLILLKTGLSCIFWTLHRLIVKNGKASEVFSLSSCIPLNCESDFSPSGDSLSFSIYRGFLFGLNTLICLSGTQKVLLNEQPNCSEKSFVINNLHFTCLQNWFVCLL